MTKATGVGRGWRRDQRKPKQELKLRPSRAGKDRSAKKDAKKAGQVTVVASKTKGPLAAAGTSAPNGQLSYAQPRLIYFPNEQTFDAFRLVTGNDCPNRDPVQWTMEAISWSTLWYISPRCPAYFCTRCPVVDLPQVSCGNKPLNQQSFQFFALCTSFLNLNR